MGAYPGRLTIISHAFKKNRFLNYHCRAIKWPLARTNFVGIDPPEEVTPRVQLVAGEAKAVEAWRNDFYGVGESLGSKRMKRGWEPTQVIEVDRPQGTSNQSPVEDGIWMGEGLGLEIPSLLRYHGGADGKTVFPKVLPWEEREIIGWSSDRASGSREYLVDISRDRN